MDVALHLQAFAQHAVAAEDALVVRLGDGPLQHLGLAVILAADVDVGDVALRREARDGDAFQQQVRVVIHQQPILERARLALIRVDGQVVRPLLFLRNE